MSRRPALTREGVIEAAVAVADRTGLPGVSMRSVGRELGVEAMSLYHHVRGKDDLLDELADWIFTQIAPPHREQPWRPTMITKATVTRSVVRDHPWALGLIESRRHAGPAMLTHHDAVLGCLRSNGFPVVLATHAFSAIDAYVYGFVLTEVNLPMTPEEEVEDFVADIGLPQGQYPHLAEMLAEQVIGKSFDYADEFAFGLGLILDGLAERLASV